MGIFSAVWQKITGSSETGSDCPHCGQPAASCSCPRSESEEPTPTGVDVEAILVAKATEKGGESNWRTSIVDLLNLLDLDSSLSARAELANELNVHAGPDGSAEQNIALHQAVMQKMEENGGKVPDKLKG